MEKLTAGSIDINDLMDYFNNKDKCKKHLKGSIIEEVKELTKEGIEKAAQDEIDDIYFYIKERARKGHSDYIIYDDKNPSYDNVWVKIFEILNKEGFNINSKIQDNGLYKITISWTES